MKQVIYRARTQY